MRLNWVLVVFVGLEMLLIGLLIGSLSVSEVATEHAPFGVLEFFLYRYQTLLAGAAAIAAAIIASVPVYRQLEQMTRQSAAAAIPNLRVIADEIESEAVAMKSIDRKIDRLPELMRVYSEADWHEIYQDWPNAANELAGEIFGAWQVIGNRIDRLDSISRERNAVHKVLARLLERLTDLSYAFRARTTGPSYEYGEEDVSGAEADRRLKALRYSHKVWMRAYRLYVPFILTERQEAWSSVRKMERRASPDRHLAS